MKYLFFLLLLLSSNSSFSQKKIDFEVFPNSNGKVIYEEIITIDSIKHDSILLLNKVLPYFSVATLHLLRLGEPSVSKAFAFKFFRHVR